MHVLDVKRHIAVTNIARPFQNGPCLLLSILNAKCCHDRTYVHAKAPCSLLGLVG